MKPENIGCKGFAGDYAANIRLGGHGPFLLTIDTSSSRTAITGNSLGRNVSKWLNFSKAEGVVNTQLKAGGAYTDGSFWSGTYWTISASIWGFTSSQANIWVAEITAGSNFILSSSQYQGILEYSLWHIVVMAHVRYGMCISYGMIRHPWAWL